MIVFRLLINTPFHLFLRTQNARMEWKSPFFRAFHVIFCGLYDAMVSTHTAFLLLVEDESYSTSADENNKQIKALKRRNSIGVGATHVALIFFLQERRRCDMILTYPNPPQGRVILIVLMYINSPSLGEGRSGSELCRPYWACKLQILNMVAFPHYPIICRPVRTYKKFFRELQWI